RRSGVSGLHLSSVFGGDCSHRLPGDPADDTAVLSVDVWDIDRDLDRLRQVVATHARARARARSRPGRLTMERAVADGEAGKRHLEEEYAGVYGPAEIEFHLNAHVGDGFADYACQVIAASTPPGGRVLDVEPGYGSFVMLPAARGFDAIGTEIAPYEVTYARRRAVAELHGVDPASVFLDQGIFHPAL